MDLSFWSKLAPGIVFETTRKQFYNRFCYKLVVKAYCARIVQEKGSIGDELEHRRKLRDSRRYNYGGSWMSRFSDQVDDANVEQLETLRSIKNGYGSRIKMRIEEPWVQIYTEDIQTLQDIAKRFPEYLHERFLSISYPESPESKKLLEEGKIIVRPSNKIEYKYKVMLRDGTYPSDTKRAVWNYITNLGRDAKMSTATSSMLLNGHNFIWGAFLYVNDPSVLTMLSLISPTMVGKIHELVDVSN